MHWFIWSQQGSFCLSIFICCPFSVHSWIYISTLTYWLSWLVCFKGSKSTHPKWNPVLPPGLATPSLLCPRSWHFVHLDATLQVWDFLGFFLILDPAIKNHQPVLSSLPLDWFRILHLCYHLPNLNYHLLLHLQSLLHTGLLKTNTSI